MSDFYIKQGDDAPALRVICKDQDGAVVDLSGATSLRFHMVKVSETTPKVDAAATLIDGPNGIVEYQWATGDTDTEGDWFGEFEITFPVGDVITFPNYKYITIEIRGEVA